MEGQVSYELQLNSRASVIPSRPARIGREAMLGALCAGFAMTRVEFTRIAYPRPTPRLAARRRSATYPAKWPSVPAACRRRPAGALDAQFNRDLEPPSIRHRPGPARQHPVGHRRALVGCVRAAPWRGLRWCLVRSGPLARLRRSQKLDPPVRSAIQLRQPDVHRLESAASISAQAGRQYVDIS